MVKFKPVDVLSNKEVWDYGHHLPDTETQALFYFSYLTAARISEALRARRKDIEVTSYKGQPVTVATLINQKSKMFKTKMIPFIWTDGEDGYDKKMTEFVLDFIWHKHQDAKCFNLKRTTAANRFRRNIEITVRAIKHTEGKGTEVVDDYLFKVHPHYLRHCRLTHLSSLPELNLVMIAGWTTVEPARIYIRESWGRIMDSALRAFSK